MWEDGQIIDLGELPGATFTTAWAINDRGQVVGTSGTRAFLWEKGRMIDIGTLPGIIQSAALAINNRGQIVGAISTTSGGGGAALWTKK
jgi:probable HAF family extracellular repeat protein